VLNEGTLVGRYEVLELIGSGGMGEVYKVRDTSVEEPGAKFLALKVLRVKSKESFDEDAELKRCFKENYERYKSQSVGQFKKEAQILFKLRHANLPRLYQYFSDDEQNTHYIVMDLIEGQNLSKLVKLADKTDYLDEARVLNWTSQLLDLLKFLHYGTREKVIYRDLKPSNIIIDADDKVKIIDFGISKIFNPDRAYISKTITILQGLGTFEYMPLEQYPEANRKILPEEIYHQVRITDERSDIFALGGTMYYLLTKAIPVPAFYRVNNDFITRPSEINPAIHPSTEKVILKALALLPRDRYQNINEMKKELETCFPQIVLEPKDASDLVFRNFRESLVTLRIRNSNSQSYTLKGQVRTDIPGVRIKPDTFEGSCEANFYLDSTKIDPGHHSGTIVIASNAGTLEIPFSFNYNIADRSSQAAIPSGEGAPADHSSEAGGLGDAAGPSLAGLERSSPEKPAVAKSMSKVLPAFPRDAQPLTLKLIVSGLGGIALIMFIVFLMKIPMKNNNPGPVSPSAPHPSISLPGPPAEMLFTELEKGDPAKVRTLLLNAPELVKARKTFTYKKSDGTVDYTNMLTPLHISVIKGDKEITTLLISRGADIREIDAHNGVTPLHIAASQGNVDIARLLIDNGADVNAINKFKFTPLHNAAGRGHLEMVKMLLSRGAGVNSKNAGGRTPLHAAAQNGHKEVVELLLAKGADVNAKSNSGMTPVKAALDRNHKDIADLLRARGGKE
jgi:serine/threonine protein kinase